MRFTFRLQVQHNDPLGDDWAALKPFEWWDLICFMERVVLVIKFVYAGQLLCTMLIDVDLHLLLHSLHFPAIAPGLWTVPQNLVLFKAVYMLVYNGNVLNGFAVQEKKSSRSKKKFFTHPSAPAT